MTPRWKRFAGRLTFGIVTLIALGELLFIVHLEHRRATVAKGYSRSFVADLLCGGECVSSNTDLIALNAINRNNDRRARYALRVNVFETMAELGDQIEGPAAEGPSPHQREAIKRLARGVLVYMEANRNRIPGDDVSRDGISGFEVILKKTADRKRIHRIASVTMANPPCEQ